MSFGDIYVLRSNSTKEKFPFICQHNIQRWSKLSISCRRSSSDGPQSIIHMKKHIYKDIFYCSLCIRKQICEKTRNIMIWRYQYYINSKTRPNTASHLHEKIFCVMVKVKGEGQTFTLLPGWGTSENNLSS